MTRLCNRSILRPHINNKRSFGPKNMLDTLDQQSPKIAQAFTNTDGTVTMGLIVAGRNELCALSRWFFSHLPTELLQIPGFPVKVAVNGSECGGKKIIPDAVREYFFTWDKEFEGRGEYDEYVDTPDLSFAFVNANWNPSKFSKQELRSQNGNTAVVNEVLRSRNNGGIVFIHNALQPLDWADIKIDLRSEPDIKYNVFDPSYRDELRDKISKVPHKPKSAGGDGVQRLVRITISNELIANAPRMQKLLETFFEQKPVFRSVIENDRDLLSGHAEETDFVPFDPEIFKPRVHHLTSDPSSWRNAPPKVKYS